MHSNLQPNDIRIAWLVPSIQAGAYFGPIIRECDRIFKETIFYTGQVWPGFSPKDPGAPQIQIVGKTSFVESVKVDTGYSKGFIVASPQIAIPLMQYKADVVIASAFSIWTVIALLLKFVYRWQVIVVYDGFSPNTSSSIAGMRSRIRALMSQLTDAFIANNKGAESYLSNVLNIPPQKIIGYSYLAPDLESLQKKSTPVNLEQPLGKPVFLFVGQLIERKGIKVLLEACIALQKQGYLDYTLLIVGDGEQQNELQAFAENANLSSQIIWTGWVEYQQLGSYFQLADVFIFPSYEDVWGMVVLEAMAFGKPVLCSKWAGAIELVTEGENGYAFDPHESGALAKLMQKYIEYPQKISEMGERAQASVAQYSPTATARVIADLSIALLSSKHPPR